MTVAAMTMKNLVRLGIVLLLSCWQCKAEGL
jgi:hypothetical protein